MTPRRRRSPQAEAVAIEWLANPVIPIVVRWSFREANVRIENRRPIESVRSDCIGRVEHACAMLDLELRQVLRGYINGLLNDRQAETIRAHVQAVADRATDRASTVGPRGTSVKFIVTTESDDDRDRAERKRNAEAWREVTEPSKRTK